MMVGLLALGLASTCYISPAWAQSGLTGVELLASPLETRIVLKSAETLGARVISADSERIVLEVGGVDPAKAIPTDFSNADAIDQVILKPSGSNRVQMIIRGHQLGSPLITLRRPHRVQPVRPTAAPATVTFDQESNGLKTPQTPQAKTEGFVMTSMQAESPVESGTAQTAALPPTDMTNETPLPATSDGTAPETAPPVMADETTPVSLNVPPAADRLPVVSPTPTEDTVELADDDTPNTWQAQAKAWIAAAMTQIDTVSEKLPFSRTIAMAICLGLGALLIGGSVALKIRQSRQRVFDLAEPKAGFSLQAMFSGLMPKGRKGRGRRRSPMAAQNRPVQRPNPQERPIGLGRVNLAQPSAVVQQRQALQQYAQQAEPLARPMGPRNKTELDRELQRSLQMRGIVEQTQTSKPLAPKAKPLQKTQPAATQPRPVSKPMQASRPAAQPNRSVFNNPEPALPANNTEVLDFLRSVADLMEQDGQTHLAKGIKKGIQTHSQQ